MAKKHWIYIKRGLSEDAKHRAAMGECIWLYMHIIDRADWETGIAFDWKDKEEAADMSLPLDTLRRQRQKLEEFDYIRSTQKQHSQDIRIMEWKNPRDYSSETKNPRFEGSHVIQPSKSEGLNQGSNQVEAQMRTPSSDSKSIPLSIENAIYAGLPVTEAMTAKENLRNIAPRQFENALGFSKTLPWWGGKDWTAFSEWVCERYAEDRLCFGNYNIWRHTQYTKGGMSNNRIRGFVNEFYDSWDMFMMATKPKTETASEYETIGLTS